MRESWTDSRLDDFAANVDKRFDSVDRRFDSVDKRFERVDSRFDKVEKRLDGVDAELKAMHRAIAQGTIALTSAFMVGFAAMIGLVATQL